MRWIKNLFKRLFGGCKGSCGAAPRSVSIPMLGYGGEGGGIRLGLKREPFWMDLPGTGIRLFVRAPSQAVSYIAREKAKNAIRELHEHVEAVVSAGGKVGDLPDLTDPAVARGLAEAEFDVALAQASVIAWEGVFTPDGKGTAPVNDTTVRDLISIDPFGALFRVAYMASMDQVETEKNGSGSAPAGTSATDQDIADGAATSEAPVPTGDGG